MKEFTLDDVKAIITGTILICNSTNEDEETEGFSLLPIINASEVYEHICNEYRRLVIMKQNENTSIKK